MGTGQVTFCTDPLCTPRQAPAPYIRDPKALTELVQRTPARLAKGRTGSRILTHVYVGIRAEHAIALDAVHAEIPAGFAESLGAVPLQSQCTAKSQYLLYPDLGRRLAQESVERLAREATADVDVQIIAGDGLAPWAILRQGQVLIPALVHELSAGGFKVGKPLFVKYARIGIADQIGVLSRARSTIILVGERPGLGTGDSLSIYTAFGPRLGQGNAEKNCISNIRPLGLAPATAAKECADLMKRTFAAGGGGVHLIKSQSQGRG